MSKEENVVRSEDAPVYNAEVEAIGGEADLDWEHNEAQSELSEQELKIVQLEMALQASEERIKEQQDAVLRARAEVENMRRRTEQEMDKSRKFALGRFAEELLPVIDNLERAIQSASTDNEAVKPILDGVELTHKTFIDVAAKFGLVAINPEGEAFNPEYHQAMSLQESPDHEPNTVLLVMQKGYELNGRVIRPAMVMVSK